jgi:hypothetical protein
MTVAEIGRQWTLVFAAFCGLPESEWLSPRASDLVAALGDLDTLAVCAELGWPLPRPRAARWPASERRERTRRRGAEA